MSYQRPKLCFLSTLAAAMLILAGCASLIQKQMGICPGAESASQAISTLKQRSQNAVPIKASGQCLLRIFADGKPLKENFPIKVWFNPAVQICLQGDVAFDPKGVVVGSNEREFWLSIKLKEISSYWWGKWYEKTFTARLGMDPELILEAFGITESGSEIKNDEGWFLSKEGAFDVLAKEEQGIIIKKIYVSRCNYLVSKIEYFDAEGKVVIVTEPDKYKQVTESFFVPAYIKITSYADDSRGDFMQITLTSIKSANFTEKQKAHLFNRPEPKGFRHIYEIIGEELFEQLQ